MNFFISNLHALFPGLTMEMLAMLDYVEWTMRANLVEYLTRIFGKRPAEQYDGFSSGPYRVMVGNSIFDRVCWKREELYRPGQPYIGPSEGQSLISLASEVFGIPIPLLLTQLFPRLGIKASYEQRFLMDCPLVSFQSVLLPPNNQEKIQFHGWDIFDTSDHEVYGAEYFAMDGRRAGMVCITEYPVGNNDQSHFCLPMIAVTNGHESFYRCFMFSKPYPVFNLHRIAAYQERPILMAFNDQAARVLSSLLSEMGMSSNYIVSTWPGGMAGAIADVGWHDCAGRRVIVLPDHSSKGYRTAFRVYKELQAVGARLSFFPCVPEAFRDDLPPKAKLNAALSTIFHLEKLWDKNQLVAAATENFNIHLEGLPAQEALAVPELLAIPAGTFDWVFQNLLRVGGRVLLYAPKGVGKSWFSMLLGLSLATGKPCCDGVFTPSQPQLVLSIDGEQALPDIQTRLKQLCTGIGVNPDALDTFRILSASVGGKPIDIGSEDFFSKNKQTLLEADVIILDNLNALIPEALEASPESARAINALVNELGLKGKTVIVVNHTSRSGNSFGTSTKEFGMDLLIRLALTKGGKRRRVEMKARYTEDPAPFEFELKVDDKGAQLVVCDDSDGPEEKGAPDALDQLIIDAWTPEKSGRAVAQELDRPAATVASRIKLLKKRGLLGKDDSASALSSQE